MTTLASAGTLTVEWSAVEESTSGPGAVVASPDEDIYETMQRILRYDVRTITAREGFWSERWQAMEREADSDLATGRFVDFEDTDDFFAELDDD